MLDLSSRQTSKGKNMAVRLKPFKPKISSRSLEKLLKSHKTIFKSRTKLWPDNNYEHPEVDDQSLQTLTLNHPILRKLESSTSTREFNQVHTQLIVSGLFQHPLAASQAVMKLCTSLYVVHHAVSLFACLEEPDAFICNTIIRTYVNLNDSFNALKFYYQEMVGKWVMPNHYTFPLLAKVCAEIRSVREGEKTHDRVVKFGFVSDLFVCNSLIHMYFIFGRIGDAQKVFDESSELDLVTWNSMIDGYVKNGDVGFAREIFDEMCERDVFSWNSMIAGYVGIGEMEAAKELFEKMPFKDVVSWNCVIDGYARVGNVSAARELFDGMPARNVVSWNTMLALYVRAKDYSECLGLFNAMIERRDAKPNEASLVSVLTACANLGRLDRGKWVHLYIKNNRIKSDVLLSTALLTMYAKCGAMDLAREVFDTMPGRSVVSWNSMIMGYGIHGHGEKALEMFLEMEKRGSMPNDATFVCVLSACTHAGMVLEGWWYFDLMHRVYKIEPKVEHYGCMVDLLGRAGLMNDSEDLIRKMPMEVGPALWGALLSACRIHSNFELGEVVAKRLIQLEPKDIGPYVLLSNIYASKGKWDDVETVRKLMKEKGLQKAAGCSLVNSGEFGSEVFVENGSVHRKSMVYSMLSEMGAQMKLSCKSDRVEKLRVQQG